MNIIQDLTITGAGAPTTIIDGNGVVTGDRVIQVGITGLVFPTVRISGVTVRGGASPSGSNGGGIFNHGDLTLNGLTVTQNTAGVSGDAAFAVGGGIASSNSISSRLTISNSTISNNTAFRNGGGVGKGVDGSLNVTNTTFSGNRAINNSGGLLMDGNVIVSNSVFTNNTAGGNGGGLRAGTTGIATLTNITVTGNTSGNGGGGLFNAGVITLSNSTFSRNIAASTGGGINSQEAPATIAIANTTVSANSARSGGGLVNSGAATITDSTIENNLATNDGGGIRETNGFRSDGTTLASTLDIQRSTISRNSAGLGGGISNFSSAMTLVDSTISGNTAGNGGGFFNGNFAVPFAGSATITNSTFNGNAATGNGGAILNAFGNTVRLLNTIVANSPSGGNCAGGVTSNGHNLSSDASCSFSGPGDLNNTNPNLGPLANNGGPTQTHALLAASPAIDAGSNTGCPSTDQRGVVRPLDGNGDGTVLCDIGAYELQPAPTPKNKAASVVGSGAADSSLGPVDFSVSVSRTAVGGAITGSLTKTIRSNSQGIRSTEITELVILSPTRVLIEGRCVKTPTGEPCTFLADISDFGPGGTRDVFLISTDGGPQLGGRLLSGDITITVAP